MMAVQPFSDYIKGKKIDPSGDKLDMLPAAEDDYRFAVRYAGRMGYEFFIIQGVVYFRKAPSSYSSIMTLSPDAGLLTVKQSLRGMSLYKKTLVAAINPADDKPVLGEAVLTGKFGDGAGAPRMLGNSQKVLFDYASESAEQAERRAKVLMQAARGDFGRLACKCVGIPELVPGRSISIDGISPDADREHYILSVRHTIDERGFFTNLEARMDVL
jgi:phage protein D